MAFFEILHVTNLTRYILLMLTVRFGLQISMKEEDLCGGDETLLLATKKGKNVTVMQLCFPLNSSPSLHPSSA